MKKTIIALLALGGIAMGATLGEIDTTDITLKAYWNFNTGNAANIGSGWSELPIWNSAGYGECGGNTKTNPYTSNLGLNINNGFTISFDINNITKNGHILTMSTGNMNQGWRVLSMTATDGVISAYINGQTSNTVTGKLDGEWNTITLVGTKITEGGTNTLGLTLFINGNEAGSTTIGAGNFVTETAKLFQFGYYGTSANSAAMDIDNILIYNRPLSADEVGALIPEPTTATLSLLALAGLAARRRRK